MLKRLNELNVVIGIFFILLSIILLAGAILSQDLSGRANVITGVVFLIFGILMVVARSGNDEVS
jgi:uncharacterized membrane protein YesL